MRLLVDGNGLACKLWWAGAHEVPQRFANAITLVQIAVGIIPERPAAVIAWDKPCWRREIMPKYKANRGPKPEALSRALLDCRALSNFRHVAADGFEADDVLATLARAALALGDTVAILTEDKDMMQLVRDEQPACFLVNARGEATHESDVLARWGVPPSRLRHLISWMGDSADGLPGVRGVGPKKGVAHALAGEIGDELTYELAELVTVPGLWRAAGNQGREDA